MRLKDSRRVEKNQKRLASHTTRFAKTIQSAFFDVSQAQVSITGWTGQTMMKPADMSSMKALVLSGKVWDEVGKFQKIPYEK
jgi:hypothetical protein